MDTSFSYILFFFYKHDYQKSLVLCSIAIPFNNILFYYISILHLFNFFSLVYSFFFFFYFFTKHRYIEPLDLSQSPALQGTISSLTDMTGGRKTKHKHGVGSSGSDTMSSTTPTMEESLKLNLPAR